jgi:hypothetical protein
MPLLPIISSFLLKFLPTSEDLMDSDMDIVQKNHMLIWMNFTFITEENDSEKKLKEEVFYEHMYFRLDFMIRILKKLDK